MATENASYNGSSLWFVMLLLLVVLCLLIYLYCDSLITTRLHSGIVAYVIFEICQAITIDFIPFRIAMYFLIIIHPLMLLAAFFLYQSKLLSLSLVWNSWFFLWTGTNKHKKAGTFDKAYFNESLFFEFVTGGGHAATIRTEWPVIQ